MYGLHFKFTVLNFDHDRHEPVTINKYQLLLQIADKHKNKTKSAYIVG